VVRGFV